MERAVDLNDFSDKGYVVFADICSDDLSFTFDQVEVFDPARDGTVSKILECRIHGLQYGSKFPSLKILLHQGLPIRRKIPPVSKKHDFVDRHMGKRKIQFVRQIEGQIGYSARIVWHDDDFQPHDDLTNVTYLIDRADNPEAGRN